MSARIVPASLAGLAWPNRTTPERLDYAVDFAALLAAGETISGTPTVSVLPAGSLVLDAGPTVAGAVVTLWFAGGAAGAQHGVQVVVATSAGRFIAARATLYCVPPLSGEPLPNPPAIDWTLLLAARDDATAAASAAAGSASAAAGSAGAAAGSASAAGSSAGAAAGSATAAATSATNAGTARTGAETARTGAETARTGAEAAQSAAAASATAAAGSAADALARAASASASASASAAAATVPVLADRLVGRRPSDTALWNVMRSTPAWGFGPDGALVETPTDTLRWEYDPLTGAALGAAFAGQRSNAVANPRGEGLLPGSPGTLPAGWTQVASATGLVRTLAAGLVQGMPGMTLQLAGTPTAGTSTVVEFAPRASAPAAAPLQPRAASVILRLRSGSLAGVTSIALRFVALTAAGAVVGGSTVGTNLLGQVDGTPRRFTWSYGVPSDATIARIVVGILVGTTVGAAVDCTLDVLMPQDEPDAAFASAPMLPPAGAPAISTRAQGTVTIAAAQLGARLQRRSGTLLLDWNSQPGPFASLSDADWLGLCSLGDGSAGERLGLLVNPAHTSVEARIVAGGIAGAVASRAMAPPAPGESIRCALAWDVASNRLQVAARGAAGTAVACPAVPLLTVLMPGRFGPSHPLFGALAGLDLRPAGIFDAALAALT